MIKLTDPENDVRSIPLDNDSIMNLLDGNNIVIRESRVDSGGLPEVLRIIEPEVHGEHVGSSKRQYYTWNSIVDALYAVAPSESGTLEDIVFDFDAYEYRAIERYTDHLKFVKETIELMITLRGGL